MIDKEGLLLNSNRAKAKTWNLVRCNANWLIGAFISPPVLTECKLSY